MVIDDIDRAIAEERRRDARAALDAAAEAGPLDWSLRLRRARLELRDADVPVDDTILEVEALLKENDAVADDLPLAHATRIDGYATKRVLALTEEAIAEAREAVGEHARILLAEGEAMMRFDERERAHACFERAIALGGAREGHARYALANALYVLGDFDAALAEADRIGEGPARRRGLRLTASCHAARQDHAAEARAYEAVLAIEPAGDQAQNDRVSYALALAASGRREAALEELGRAWREDPDAGPGRYARARMNHLERHLDGGRRAQLPAFPTTAQRWNYCGPAVLELCFRYLQIELSQEEIADTVKRSGGTPMYEIVTFLRAHDIAARRVRATHERLMRAIDLGLPVIIQEEYSTTSHVAVITGYDEALGTFVAHDPATHRPLLKTFEFTRRAGDLYGNGGVIVLGRPGPELAALEARCDEAGLVDEPSLTLLDDVDRLRPDARGEREGATLHEVLRRCDEAIAHDPGLKLAWHRRLDARQRLARLTGRPRERDLMLADLHHVRVRFAADEWPHQLHAHALFDRNLLDEAYAEYLEASLRDPGDANNRAWMGECMWLGGDLPRAAKHLREALARSPLHVRAAENLAAVYARELSERRTKGGPAESSLAPARVYERITTDGAELLRRAEHLNRVGRAHHPNNPFNHEVAGDLAAMREDWDASVAFYAEARRLDPRRSFATLGLARGLHQLGELEEARGLLDELTRDGRGPTRAFTLHAEVLEALGRGEEAAARTSAALAMGVDPAALSRVLFDVYARLGSKESAAARLRELAEGRSSDAALLRAVGKVLDAEAQRGHAIALFRHVVAAAPTDVDSVYRLGTLLVRDVLTRPEGVRHLRRVVELAPDFPWARIHLGWALLERDPSEGLRLLDALPDQEDAYVLEAKAALLAARDGEEAAAPTLERALQTWGDPQKGLLSLTEWHLDDQRYDRALQLARRIPERVVDPALQDRANRRWLSAFRLGGAMRDAVDRLGELCADGVPGSLAWSVYWGMYTIDHALAAEAAERMAERTRGATRTTWRIRAATQRAKLGDDAPLATIASELEEHAESWAQLSFAYDALRRFEEAAEAAERAMAIDPREQEALTAMEGAWVRRGDVERAIACARELVALFPYEHVGPERLGILLAQRLEVEEALPLSLRAVDAAPYCHVAHRARALALFAAGDLDGARRHALSGLALHEPDGDDDDDRSLMIRYATDGAVDALEACLRTLHAGQPAELFAAFDARLREVARSARA